MEKVGDPLDKREYTEENLDAIAYSEDGLFVMRRLTRGERAIAKKLSPAAFDVALKAIEVFVKRHE